MVAAWSTPGHHRPGPDCVTAHRRVQCQRQWLIPLYAIGVFLSFTLSQAGMAHRWWKLGHLLMGQEVKERGSTLRYESRWRLKMLINGFGAVCTAIVMLVFAITKFAEGAWIVLLLMPLVVFVFSRIHHHYLDLAARLSLERYGEPPRILRQCVIIPLSGVHRGTLEALRYARSLSDDITAVHVSIDPAEAEAVRQKWELWGEVRAWSFLSPLIDCCSSPCCSILPKSPGSVSRMKPSPSSCRSSCPGGGGITSCTTRRRSCCDWHCCSDGGSSSPMCHSMLNDTSMHPG